MDSLHRILSKYKLSLMALFLVFLLVIAVITGVHFHNNPDSEQISENNAVTTRPENTLSSGTNGDEKDPELSGDSTFLVVCRDENGKNVIFMTLLDFRIYSENIILTMLSPDTRYGGRTYEDILSYGGIKMLVDAVESVRQCTVDRYAVTDREGFCEIADIMGKVPMNVTESFSYRSSDKSYEVEIGENEMESAMLYTYIKLNSEKPDGLKRVSELLCTVINTYLASADTEEAQELFGELCDCVNTNITVFDYYSCASDIEYLITHNAKCSVFEVG